jgi:hypothetical protein
LSSYIALAQQGIKFTFYISGTVGMTTADLKAQLALIEKVNAAVPGSVVAVEGLNEINNFAFTYNGVGGLQGATNLQKDLYAAVHSNSGLSGVAVDYFTGYAAGSIAAGSNPSTTAGLADYDTQHPYPNGGEAPAAWVSPSKALSNETSGAGPAVYTETGYSSNGGTTGAVNADVQAKYTLDLLMDTARDGIARTYLYQLMDAYQAGSRQGDDGTGLFDSNNLSKSAATAIHDLTSILADTGSTASAFTPTTLSYSLANLPTTGNSLEMEKSNGAYDIVVWNEPQIWNEATGKEITFAPTTVTLNLASTYATVELFDPLSSAAPIKTLSNVSSVQLSITDHPLIVEIEPANRINVTAGQTVATNSTQSSYALTDSAAPVAPSDYNGDGNSDLVLVNTNGSIVIETQSNLTPTGGVAVSDPGPTWHVVSTADMDGNGSPDLLLQNDDGDIVDYIMSGTTVLGGFDLTDPGPTWHVRGVGDFNGVGKADLVLQNDNGTIAIDYTNGSSVIGAVTIGNPGPGWTVETVADINGDGQPDLLLENTNGQIVDYLMNGATPVAGYLLDTLPAGEAVEGVGNYNGDSFGDIVVHNDNGSDVVLDTNGESVIGSAPIISPGPTWTGVVAGMDYNGDGSSDLLVENTSGNLVGFTLNTSDDVTAGASLGTPGVGWSVIGNTPMQFIDGTGPTLAPLTGTVGADEFNLTSIGATGLHSLNGFDPSMDLVALSSATFANYTAVQAAEQPYQGGTFIALPGASGVLIQGVTPAQLSSANIVLR